MSLAFSAQAEQYVSERAGNRFPALEFHPKHAAGVKLDALPGAHNFDDGGGVELRFGMEPERNPRSLAFHRRDTQLLADGFENRVLQKVFYGFRRGAKTIRQFLVHVLLFGFGGDGGDALVSAQAEIFAGDVLLRDADVHAQAEGGAKFGHGLFALELGDGAFEHLDVEIEADGLDVAVLLAAEE